MGTGGLVLFRSVRGGKPAVYACIYFQCDGYYQSLGVRLAEFLMSCKLVNGLGLPSADDEGKIICNGFGCLVAQFVAQFKTRPGHLYFFPADGKLDMEYVYVVEHDCNASGQVLSVKAWRGSDPQQENGAKSMSPADFRAFSQRNGDDEDESESMPAACPKESKKLRSA